MHEKSKLVSTPLKLEELNDFNRDKYTVDYVLSNIDNLIKIPFINRNLSPNKAITDIVQTSFDYYHSMENEFKNEKNIIKNKKDFESKNDPLLNEIYLNNESIEKIIPPCIKLLLEGIEDGKKRGLFILSKYFQSLNWPYELIEKKIFEWNKLNKEELRENYIFSQLNHMKKNFSDKFLPPNCSNEAYYKDLNICFPDNICKRIKNPINYSKIKANKMIYFKSGPKKSKKTTKSSKDKTQEENPFHKK